MARLAVLRERLRATLWVPPILGLLLAVALSVLTIYLDDSIEVGSSAVVGFDGGADSARSILSTIAASMLTFLGLVFTLTVVALQLATGFSPRLLRNFLSSRSSKLALALFVITFTYSVLVLREVDVTSVPELSVTTAIVLVVLSVVIFLYYLSEVAQSLRIANIVAQAGSATREELERYEIDGDPGDEDEERGAGWSELREMRRAPRTLHREGPPGVLGALDLEGLRAVACEHDVVLALRVQVGDFVPGGAPIADVHGEAAEEVESEPLQNHLALANERSFRQDAAFGLRQLVDVASRGLSPGINDPTTAVQALDQIHDLLLRIGGKRLYSGVLRDQEDSLRVLVPVHSWENYVHLACDEIRLYGEDSLQVSRRMRAMLDDLAERLPECRREPVQTQLELLGRAVDRGFDEVSDRERALAGSNSPGGSEGGSGSSDNPGGD